MIPKIIHQIWIGEVDLPADWKRWCQTVKSAHPDWEYKMWTNDDIHSLIADQSQDIKDYYELVKTNKRWAWMVDIMRYIITYKYGGIYLDSDFKMVKGKSLNELPLEKELLLVNTLDSTPERPQYQIQNCFMGAIPNNEFMKTVISNVRKRDYVYQGKERLEIYAVKYFTTEYYLHINPSYAGEIPFRTINMEIKDLIPSAHRVLEKEYFFGKNAKIAIHFNKESHVKQNLWKYAKNNIVDKPI